MKKFILLFLTAMFLVVACLSTVVSAEEYYSAVTVKSDFDFTSAYLITDYGQIYYLGYNYLTDTNKDVRPYIFTMDKKGNVIHSAQLSFNWANIRFKQTGDNICVIYNKFENGEAKNLVCEKFDKELNNIGKYDLSAFKNCDMSDNKICYHNKDKIYICDLNGKNKKAIVDLSAYMTSTTIVSGLAINDKYVAYTLRETLSTDQKFYYGYYSLRSGKGGIYKSDLVNGVKAFDDNMLYYSYVHQTPQKNTLKLEGSGKYIALINGKTSATKTFDSLEPTQGGTITSDGKIITWMGNRGSKKITDGIYIRIYENGELISEKILKIDSILYFCANGGKIAVSYEEKESGKRTMKTKLIDY